MATKKMINVRLDPEVWKRAKAAAGERGQTLERWVTDALEAHVALTRSGGPATISPPGTDGALGGGPVGAAAGGELAELTRRVTELEQAVDYLATQIVSGQPSA